MIAAILRAWKGEGALATQGNFNNDIGVPLTLLRLRAAHEAAVVEMGMNHPGEIALLAGMTAPTVALVNNAQREHLEFMATVEAVARENGSVIESLGAQGVAVFPADDSFAPLWSELCGQRRRLTFSDAVEGGLGDVQGHGGWQDGAWSVTARTPAGGLNFRLGIAGRHNVRNALAAATCALAAGAPLDAIRAGLQAFEAVKGRSRAFSVFLAGRRVTVVDDTYNANPDSVRAAIEVLAELPAPRLLVLGDMGEVGDQGPSFHAEIGALARDRGLEQLFTLGPQSVHAAQQCPGACHFEEMTALLEAVRSASPGVASILVKGSRFMKMERVVDAIVRLAQEQQGGIVHAA
jgi:UDP-N-acetylmuramoyl-tripeptide--D-alanyl-D-alanine ligase